MALHTKKSIFFSLIIASTTRMLDQQRGMQNQEQKRIQGKAIKTKKM